MPESKSDTYRLLATQLKALLAGESDMIANAANTAAFVYSQLPDCNWVGFYFLKNEELVVGPFQGEPACVRIPIGRGVCGTAAANREVLVVSNVHEFSDHIACDARSNSELAVPIVVENELVGVLDIDSPLFDRFDDVDRDGLESLAQIFTDSIT